MIDPDFNCAFEKKIFLAQEIPMIGPIVISPLIAVTSLVEMVAGGVLLAIGKIWESISGKKPNFYKCAEIHAVMGAIKSSLSILNIFTLGFIGYVAFRNIFGDDCKIGNAVLSLDENKKNIIIRPLPFEEWTYGR